MSTQPQQNPSAVAIFFSRLTSTPRGQLNPTDAEARTTYDIVCGILDAAERPSVSGYIPTRIATYHVTWLNKLPAFGRVARIEVCHDLARNETYHRLWLLTDWLSNEEQQRARAASYNAATREFLTLRYRFWRVYRALRDEFLVSHTAAQAQLETYYRAYRLNVPEAMKCLERLHFMDSVDDREVDAFHDRFKHKVGHVYASPIDFTQEKNHEES